MAAHFFRTLTFATILFGSLALAYPPVSKQVDRLLYGERRSEWETPSESQNASENQAISPTAEAPRGSPTSDPFAWQADVPESDGNHDRAVVPASHFVADETPRKERNASQQIRSELEACGAQGIEIEAGDSRSQSAFTARCIVPISPGSRYGKPFTTAENTADLALEALLHEVRSWQNRKRPS